MANANYNVWSGQTKIEIEWEIDVEEADPSVGIFQPSFDVGYPYIEKWGNIPRSELDPEFLTDAESFLDDWIHADENKSTLHNLIDGWCEDENERIMCSRMSG
ncbi:MAG: hypothetical protein DWQ49_06555 [Bacteroidetes bacterium]|nr:MAG: hypothetical protein DWQ49_06555 [Bacteroidota bacterium]